ncbi:hypothetical protein NK6_2886 [Bradyrhizobium diazoefficiens]|uniref:Uncharacterized protein n=1 Tax=Bradyrhizobium diazoefficiens TaxID=1355477 RepID=A0A0E4FSU7_9BRAD|nr:hypothetical protein NK6_2886 [Bradyrhizobium diazoefficiens]
MTSLIWAGSFHPPIHTKRLIARGEALRAIDGDTRA